MKKERFTLLHHASEALKDAGDGPENAYWGAYLYGRVHRPSAWQVATWAYDADTLRGYVETLLDYHKGWGIRCFEQLEQIRVNGKEIGSSPIKLDYGEANLLLYELQYGYVVDVDGLWNVQVREEYKKRKLKGEKLEMRSDPIDDEQVKHSREWLKRFTKRRTKAYTDHGSYGLKHAAEDWAGDNWGGNYVTEGAFIKAAIMEGYRIIPAIPRKHRKKLLAKAHVYVCLSVPKRGTDAWMEAFSCDKNGYKVQFKGHRFRDE